MRASVSGILALFGLVACLPGLAAESAPDQQVFTTYCAACHQENAAPKGSPNEQAPTRTQLRQFTPEAVLTALTNGKMQQQGSSLSEPQRRLVSEYVTGKRLTAAPVATAQVVESLQPRTRPCRIRRAAPSWNGHGNGPAATRFQDAKAGGITAADLPRLKLKWAFGYANVGAARAQPTLAGGRLFVASENGEVHALDPKTGCTLLDLQGTGRRAHRAVGGAVSRRQWQAGYAVFFGDGRANVYAVDAQTGTQVWTAQVDEHRLRRDHRRAHRLRRPPVRRYAGSGRGRPWQHRRLRLLHLPRQPHRARHHHRQGAVEDLHRRSLAAAREEQGRRADVRTGRRFDLVRAFRRREARPGLRGHRQCLRRSAAEDDQCRGRLRPEDRRGALVPADHGGRCLGDGLPGQEPGQSRLPGDAGPGLRLLRHADTGTRRQSRPHRAAAEIRHRLRARSGPQRRARLAARLRQGQRPRRPVGRRRRRHELLHRHQRFPRPTRRAA